MTDANGSKGRRLWLDPAVHRELVRLSIPTIISTLAVPMLGLVDTIVLGRLPDVTQLGGAATATVIFNVIFWVFGFLRMGTTGLVAHAHGRGDENESVRLLFQAVLLGAGIGLALIALQGVIGTVGFTLIGGQERVRELGRAYFNIRIYEAPMFLMLLGITGYMRGRGDALTPMYLTIGINVINIVGDLLLVPGLWGLPSWGVQGAAIASVIAQGSGCIAAWLIVWRQVGRYWDWTWLQHLRTLPWSRFLNVQRDLFFRTLSLTLTLGAVTSLAARLELPHHLAAHAILMQLWSLVSYAVDGFAYATETTVGQWLGRGKPQRAQASAYASLLWGVGSGIIFAGVYLVAVEGIAGLFTVDPLVRQVVVNLAWVVAISQPINALAYIFDGILIGAMDTKYLRNAMFISSGTFIVAIALGWWQQGLSLNLVWWCLVLFMAMRAATLAVRFRSGAWLEDQSLGMIPKA